MTAQMFLRTNLKRLIKPLPVPKGYSQEIEFPDVARLMYSGFNPTTVGLAIVRWFPEPLIHFQPFRVIQGTVQITEQDLFNNPGHKQRLELLTNQLHVNWLSMLDILKEEQEAGRCK